MAVRTAETLGVERRRQYTQEDKLRIVEESLMPGSSINSVCRRYDIAPRLVYQWRSRARKAGIIRPARAVSQPRSVDPPPPVPSAPTAIAADVKAITIAPKASMPAPSTPAE